jgi:hypothetical protein
MPYLFITTTLLAFLLAQIAKFLIKANHLAWRWKNLFAYSGMPSSHAAASIALTMLIGLKFSFSSPLFAIMLFFTILIMRDAVGIRRYIGAQGEVINDLVKDLGDDQYLNQNYPKMKERVGHTKRQLLVGSLIGLVIALIMNNF